MRMMRTEVGEVSNRGAWADPNLATPEIMELYKAQLRMQGWDAAIMEVRACLDGCLSEHDAVHVTMCNPLSDFLWLKVACVPM